MTTGASSKIAAIRVGGDRPYEVIIGTGLLATVADQIGPSAIRVAVIHPPALCGAAQELCRAIAATSRIVITIEVPEAEQAKTTAVLDMCWATLGKAGFTRTDVIIGLGGGATTDLAGFVAATWLRGVGLIAVPTTLLGMVDAAVGGKTGINTAQGKNLVGAFYAPRLVVCDLDLLDSMPRRDYVAGLAEVIKCGFIADPVILDLVERDPVAATDPGSPVTAELVRRAVQVKADVVSVDAHEVAGTRPDGSIGREALNYGHTLAHAIERNEDYTWRHGDAVSVGLVFAAELGRASGRLADDVADRHAGVLRSVGLPTDYRPDQWPTLLEAMKLDKKTRGDQLRFVILAGLARPILLEGPDPAVLLSAYSAVSGGAVTGNTVLGNTVSDGKEDSRG